MRCNSKREFNLCDSNCDSFLSLPLIFTLCKLRFCYAFVTLVVLVNVGKIDWNISGFMDALSFPPSLYHLHRGCIHARWNASLVMNMVKRPMLHSNGLKRME